VINNSQIYTDKIVHYKVTVGNGDYLIENNPKHKVEVTSYRSLISNYNRFLTFKNEDADGNNGKGSKYQMVAALIPSNLESNKLADYDYLVIILEDLDGVNKFSASLRTDIEKEFWVLMLIVVG